MEHKGDARIGVKVKVDLASAISADAKARGHWRIEVRDRDGNVTDVREFENLVTTEGKNHLLAVTLDGETQDTTWFVGLTSATPTAAAGDTLPSHAGWTEVTAYTGNRKAAVFGTAASGSLDNSASPASFAINADGTGVGGAFLAAVDTGTSGKLYAIGAFTGGNLTLSNGSTLAVTCTFTV
jgi:hypothetical protein